MDFESDLVERRRNTDIYMIRKIPVALVVVSKHARNRAPVIGPASFENSVVSDCLCFPRIRVGSAPSAILTMIHPFEGKFGNSRG